MVMTRTSTPQQVTKPQGKKVKGGKCPPYKNAPKRKKRPDPAEFQ